jgi:hypothetical protein
MKEPKYIAMSGAALSEMASNDIPSVPHRLTIDKPTRKI